MRPQQNGAMGDGYQRIVFGSEVDDVLRLLCERGLAVTVVFQDGRTFGAVLGGPANGVLI